MEAGNSYLTLWQKRNGDYRTRYEYSHVDEKYLLDPICNVNFIDDRNLKITINKNRGANRQFKIVFRDPELNVSSKDFTVFQRGYKGRIDEN